MLTLFELGAKQCRYPMTDAPPHYFCGETTDGRSYCATHDNLCHTGMGKPWQGLAGMIEATEQTIIRSAPTDDLQPDLDAALRGAGWIDKAGGLMERT